MTQDQIMFDLGRLSGQEAALDAKLREIKKQLKEIKQQRNDLLVAFNVLESIKQQEGQADDAVQADS